MPTFQFEAMDNTGREVKDTIDAPSEEEAQTKIRQMGYFVTKMSVSGQRRDRKRKKKAPKASKRKKSFTIGKVGAKQLTTFTRQLSVLQDAGLPLLRSLRILEGQCKAGVLKNALIDVVDEIEAGSTLSEAMAKCPKCFDRLYVNMIKAGEAGGALEVILQRLAYFKERAQSLKRRVRSAMVYPVLVICAATAIVSLILIFVIPQFKDIFADFDIELPRITVLLLAASDVVRYNAWLLLVVPISLFVLIKLIRLNRTGRFATDWLKLRIPVFGKITEKTVVARTARTLATLVSSGVPILEGLIIARDTAGNAVFERAYHRVYESIREGDTIAQPLKEARVVDDMVVNMIDVGEETGELDVMLNKISDVYDEEVSALVEGLVSMLEPVMILVLGGIIGFIVIALFMPMIKIIEDLSKS
jgi:type IV pilus assembly protein PilC